MRDSHLTPQAHSGDFGIIVTALAVSRVIGKKSGPMTTTPEA
jgi:hypothetical protein